eukprot:CAMPEP_0114554890 /NCGR_PEP_ID=MMETSP0114-20121206/8451_1 /TAXON_ID=31324 /ORGANISM="Goniomonas sp, Strain m" /LENGTH=321 /DNA_ID=CAMNT_0001739967 /DNA_START=267 /DNA_END=1232 /DNA_ORIENTATION=-
MVGKGQNTGQWAWNVGDLVPPGQYVLVMRVDLSTGVETGQSEPFHIACCPGHRAVDCPGYDLRMASVVIVVGFALPCCAFSAAVIWIRRLMLGGRLLPWSPAPRQPNNRAERQATSSGSNPARPAPVVYESHNFDFTNAQGPGNPTAEAVRKALASPFALGTECIICMDAVSNARSVPCGHGACKSCLVDLVFRNLSCPLCRTPIEAVVHVSDGLTCGSVDPVSVIPSSNHASSDDVGCESVSTGDLQPMTPTFLPAHPWPPLFAPLTVAPLLPGELIVQTPTSPTNGSLAITDLDVPAPAPASLSTQFLWSVPSQAAPES